MAHDVTDSNEQTISGVYSYERAVIESTSNANEKWTIYNLKDVLEPALYADLLPGLRTALTNTTVSLDETYGNILGKNDRKLRVKLKLNASVSQNPTPVSDVAYTMDISIPVSVAGAHSLDAVIFCNNQYCPVHATLIGTTLKVYAGEGLNKIADGTTWNSQGWSMFINSEILL